MRKGQAFRILFEDHPQPAFVLDAANLRFLEANSAACALYGYSRDEFLAMTLPDVEGADQTQRFMAELQKAEHPPVRTWRHRAKDGRSFDIEIATRDIEYGGQPALILFLTDITARRLLEEQLRQAQKMEAVGMLAGGVAHDFNNLLTIITGYSQLILNTLLAGDPNRQSLEQILKAGERAAALTRQLLTFSRRQVLQPKVLEVNKLVTSLSTMLHRLIGEDIDLRLMLRPDAGRVNADPGQLEQVLMNLAVNARDAMPRGGALTIETARVQLDETYATQHVTAQPGPYVLLAVSDTGAGMDQATLARLFEPFFTTKGSGRGTGLGLFTVVGIVKQSGGGVDVESQPGSGTTVRVYLPRIEEPVPVEAERQERRVGRGSETILLVEDDEMVRVLVRETLDREGYRTLEAAGPAEALRIAKDYKGSIQLLITDVVMPKVSGRELADILTRRRPELKVLYMSGYTDNAIVNSGILEKEVAFLQKPFSPATLAEKVRDVLEDNGHHSWRAGG